MDEQQGLPLHLLHNHVHTALQEFLEETKEIGNTQEELRKQIVQPMEQRKTPIVWCGVTDLSHDVTICLVPNRINQFMSTETEHHRQTLMKLKVHSSRLSKCSKYFETCLTERWTKPRSTPSLEFVLETHADVACYQDCFSRMYTPPFFKNFKDVKYSLELLKVASQIQFHELMESISLYLSSKLWSDTDEMLIRVYSANPDFPRNHAQDLVVRLGMDESKEECRKQLCDVIEHCIRTALVYDGNFLSNRALVREILLGSELNVHTSNFMSDAVMIVSREAKDMLVSVGKECEGRTYLSVPRFADKILAICWILESLLAAKVAEELVECFVHLQAFPKILAIENPNFPTFGTNSGLENSIKQRDARNAAVELAKLALVIYQEVAAGNLLLKLPERIALLENWHFRLGQLLLGSNCSFDQATKNLFMTLPLKQQLELVKLRKDSNYESYISKNSLAMVLKKRWPAATDVKFGLPSPSSS